MSISPAIRAKRILLRMTNFKDLLENALPDYTGQVTLSAGEKVIGVYENFVDTRTEAVLVTDLRLIVERHGEWEPVAYREIVCVGIPEPAKVDADNTVLTMRLLNGNTFMVPIRGMHGRFYDLYEFCRFVQRVRDDAESNR